MDAHPVVVSGTKDVSVLVLVRHQRRYAHRFVLIHRAEHLLGVVLALVLA
jgi:hypothetical protein